MSVGIRSCKLISAIFRVFPKIYDLGLPLAAQQSINVQPLKTRVLSMSSSRSFRSGFSSSKANDVHNNRFRKSNSQ